MYLIKSKTQGEDVINPGSHQMEFLLDSAEEVSDLPYINETYKRFGHPAIGSTAVVKGSGEVYVLGNDGWSLL